MLFDHARPDGAEEPADPFLIRHPVHAAQVEEDGWSGWSGTAIFTGFNAEGYGDDGRLPPVLLHAQRIGIGDGGHAVHLLQHLLLIGFQLAGEVSPVGLLQYVALTLCDTLLDHMLQVVRAEHDACLGIPAQRGDVGRYEKAFQLDDIELFLGQQLDQPDVHVRREEAADVVVVRGHQVGEGVHHVQRGIHENAFDAGLLAVILGYGGHLQRMLLGADAKHLHLMPRIQQSLRDVVHGLGPSVDGRVGRLIAQLEYAHGVF